MAVYWAAIAPKTRPAGFVASDPGSAGYYWTTLDAKVRKLSSDGFRVLLTIQDAPTWAEGANKPSYAIGGTWKPSAVDLKAFAHAIAERYDGHFLSAGSDLPKVTDFEAWNEPNMSQYLSPQWSNDNGQCSAKFSGTGAESPTLFRGMLNAFYAGIKAVSATDTVVMGGTAPYGDPNCVPGGGKPDYRMSAVPFTRGVFCLTSADKRKSGCESVSHLDAIDTHPYPPPYSGFGPEWHAPGGGNVAVPDVHKLVSVLRAAESAGTVSPRHDIATWVTEIAWDSNPPDKYGVSELKAAHWIERAFYILWKQDVRTVLWWQLGDVSNFNLESADNAWPGGSGLYTSTGKAKPGATAFAFPFITQRTNKTKLEAWGRAPVAGTLKIERKSGKRWVVVKSAHVGALEVFASPIDNSRSSLFRAKIGKHVSLTWSQTG